MPAAKKDPSTRKRRNTASTAATFSAVRAAEEHEVPELPSLGRRKWHPAVVAWWRDVWTSPMASAFLDVDRRALEVIALLELDFWTAKTAKDRRAAAAELRLQRKDFGLTPYDRRRMEWTIRPVEPAPNVSGPQRAPAPEDDGPDPRVALHAV